MGNFAENLNLGNRFRPPFLGFRIVKTSAKITKCLKNRPIFQEKNLKMGILISAKITAIKLGRGCSWLKRLCTPVQLKI